MGFLGSWRNIVRNSKNRVTGVVDTQAVSRKILTQADKLQLQTISHLFDNQYLKNIDNQAFLGELELNAFIKASRMGDYHHSFKKAFVGTTLLRDANVERTLQKLLAEAATTLPDLRLAQNADAVSRGRTIFAVTEQLNTVDDLRRAIAKNNHLNRTMDKLVSSVHRTKKLKFLGYTIVFTAAFITAEDIYNKCVEISRNGTGCFLYYTAGNEIKKCKVKPYSCLHGDSGDLCPVLLLTDDIVRCMDCQQDSNRKKPCLHCDHDDELNKQLDENHVLRCESPDAMDVLLEGVHQTIDGITSVGGHTLSSIAHGLGFALMLIGAIVAIIIVIQILY